MHRNIFWLVSACRTLYRLKIIYQCQGKSHAYGGVGSALAKIWREEGVKGMFRGNGEDFFVNT